MAHSSSRFRSEDAKRSFIPPCFDGLELFGTTIDSALGAGVPVMCLDIGFVVLISELLSLWPQVLIDDRCIGSPVKIRISRLALLVF